MENVYIEHLISQFKHACKEFGLTIIIEKQTSWVKMILHFDQALLSITSQYTYPGSVISNNLSLDKSTYRLWNKSADLAYQTKGILESRFKQTASRQWKLFNIHRTGQPHEKQPSSLLVEPATGHRRVGRLTQFFKDFCQKDLKLTDNDCRELRTASRRSRWMTSCWWRRTREELEKA